MTKTWQAEMLAVGAVLAIVTIITGGHAVEFLGAGAVLLSFGHAQVADRLAEGEHERRAYYRDAVADRHAVDCYHWATRYLVGKEALWFAYFVLHQSWSALAGVVLFISYPLWRRFWRSRMPLKEAA